MSNALRVLYRCSAWGARQAASTTPATGRCHGRVGLLRKLRKHLLACESS